MIGHGEENAEAYHLPDDGCKGCSRYAHAGSEYQQRVKHNVQQGSGHDAYHGIARVALQAELVVQRERAHEKGRTAEDNAHIALGIRQDGGRAAEGRGDGA